MIPRWLSLLSALPLLATDARTIARDLEARYQHATTLKASFFESYREGSEGTGGKRTGASGTVYFSRPGRMRWEYESPETKLFLVDGTNAWFYVPADHTASRAKVKESSDWRTPIALLAGKANLSQLCKQIDLVDPANTKSDEEKPLAAGDAVLRCEPRGDSATNDLLGVILEIDSQDYLTRVVIREAGDVETEFHFQTPPGVAIVDEGSLENELH